MSQSLADKPQAGQDAMDKIITETKVVRMSATCALFFSSSYFIVKRAKLNKRRHLQQDADSCTRSKLHDQEDSRCGQEPCRPMERSDATGGAQFNCACQGWSLSGVRPNVVDKFIKTIYRLGEIFHLAMTFKYAILIILESKSARDYHYLSCFIIGRLLVNGRVTDLTNYAAFNACFFMTVWRIVMLEIRPKFIFNCLEFLLLDYDELLVAEARAANGECAGTSTVGDRRSLGALEDTGSSHECVLAFKNPFGLGQTQAQVFRLNRTCKAWTSLARQMIVYQLSVLVVLLLLAPIFVLMMAPLALTNRGFELTYSQCVGWIDRQPNRLDYSFIRAPELAPANGTTKPSMFFLPLEGFCQFNFYHSIRISWEIIENVIIYLEIVAAFIGNSTLAVLTAADVRQYSREISNQLRQLIKMPVQLQHQLGYSTRSSHYSSVLTGRQSQVTSLQAMIVDYFATIRLYNRYASFFTAYSVLIWLLFSGLISSWMLIPGSFVDITKVEWYALQVIACICVFIVLGTFAKARAASIRLYSLITIAASLDTGDHEKKQRWLKIMEFYHPKPSYCFTIFKSSELSWLFALKLVAWLISALLVAWSFVSFYGHR